MNNILESEFYNIDSTNLTEEFANQPARYIELIKAFNLAERENARAKASEERAYAAADEDYRLQLSEEGRKYTETMIKSMVILDEEYIKAQELASDASNKMTLFKQLLRAMEMRSDMLISMGAHMRAELSMTGMKIKEKEYDDNLEEVRQNLKKVKSQNT